MIRSLDEKLAEINASPHTTPAFIITDAKNADMAFGVRVPGHRDYGCKINVPENQHAFIEVLRLITDGKLEPEEAVRAYHEVLKIKKIMPHRSLENDLHAANQAMSYDGSAKRRATVEARNNPLVKAKSGTKAESWWPKLVNGYPDFERMNSDQRVACDQARIKYVFK